MNRKALFVFTLLVLGVGAIFSFEYIKFYDGRLHVVFCDVGQGDGIFIRSPSGKNFLIDAGPDNKIVDCVEKHTPFWDRAISLAFLTHPHLDHFYGYNYILKKYNIRHFVAERLENDSISFRNLQDLLKKENIKISYAYAGDKFRLREGLSFTIIGPSVDYLSQTSPGGYIGESGEFASLLILISYGDFDALATGDSQANGLSESSSRYELRNLEILQVPHHGSKTSLNNEIVRALNPKVAIMSVGRKNKYGHPSIFTTTLLNGFNIPILRTDKDGDVEIVSDGKRWGRVN